MDNCVSGDGESPRRRLLATVERLVAAHASGTLSAGRAAAALGLDLARSAAGSTPSFTVYEGEGASGPIARVELRVLTSTAAHLLILTVGADVPVGKEDVLRVYGADPELDVPVAHAPPEAPLYYRYHFPWGCLSFGFSRDAAERLTTVVFDTIDRVSTA